MIPWRHQLPRVSVSLPRTLGSADRQRPACFPRCNSEASLALTKQGNSLPRQTEAASVHLCWWMLTPDAWRAHQQARHLTKACNMACQSLADHRFKPASHWIDHETSKELIRTIKRKGLKCEVMPPSNHRQNPAERAIQTFKGRFIAILNGMDAEFPPGAWDLLIP